MPARSLRSGTAFNASRGKASLVYGRGGNPQEKLRFGLSGGAYVRNYAEGIRLKALGDTEELKGSSKRASKAQKRDILDLLSFGMDDTSVRRAWLQPAQRNTVQC